MAEDPAYLVVAVIVAPFGIKGEVKAKVLTDFPDRLADRKLVYLGRESEEPRPYTVRGIRFHQGQALFTFAECQDRTAAEALRGLLVQTPSAQAAPLPPGAYYFHQIIGLDVWGADGVHHGKVSAILTTAANDVYVVDGEQGSILIPAIPAVVRQVDLEAGRMIVETAGLASGASR